MNGDCIKEKSIFDVLIAEYQLEKQKVRQNIAKTAKRKMNWKDIKDIMKKEN